MTLQKNNLHNDYFGTPINVGDIVLGAKGKRNDFQDTTYCFSVVVAKTKGMIRLHQLGDQKKCTTMPKDEILEQVKCRGGRKGGRMISANVVNLGINCGITEKEFNEAIKQGVPDTTHRLPFPF
jgi:hypothetical protein